MPAYAGMQEVCESFKERLWVEASSLEGASQDVTGCQAEQHPPVKRRCGGTESGQDASFGIQPERFPGVEFELSGVGALKSEQDKLPQPRGSVCMRNGMTQRQNNT